jgi:hypothetical protein
VEDPVSCSIASSMILNFSSGSRLRETAYFRKAAEVVRDKGPEASPLGEALL